MSSSPIVDLRDYDTPGRGRGILDVFRKRYLLRLLVRKGTATRYRNSVLGWTWSYVKPASQFVIYYFVMGIILNAHRDVENFAIYLFSGVVLINLFNEAFSNATTAIVDNGSLVKKIYLPRELFPVSAIIVALIHFLPQLAILALVCILVGWTPTLAGIGAAVLGVLLVVALAVGLGLFFSGINVRYRDAQNLVEVIRMFATWTSPVLYIWPLVRNTMPDWAFNIYMSNPLTIGVELFHRGFWADTVQNTHGLPPGFAVYAMIATGAVLIFLTAGQLTFRRFERTFAQDL
ncbi:ABC transporter permease [Microbacterium sp. zg-Y818]|uniref:ABC transporter permease n=1 Tax=unclassified Microbacterium TaxID=2609290 RepID=UPI00214ADA0D|nr:MULTISPECIES: ABC transporter permease [unclassified Microbacterium]MCR2801730.1 ABC transporter permease [Microbacterium sp. zg.Y818]WIM23003.1 ABC transporter permease [Microbacterium sp. zg-Y818]